MSTIKPNSIQYNGWYEICCHLQCFNHSTHIHFFLLFIQSFRNDFRLDLPYIYYVSFISKLKAFFRAGKIVVVFFSLILWYVASMWKFCLTIFNLKIETFYLKQCHIWLSRFEHFLINMTKTISYISHG